jgi:hypothetical protein
VRPAAAAAALALQALLAEAERLTDHGPVLVALDLPLGVPHEYVIAWAAHTGLPGTASFLDLLRWTAAAPRFFAPTSHARDWTLDRPFFIVPAGTGD